MSRIGLDSANQVGDRYGIAWNANGLGVAYRERGRFLEARDHFEQSLAVRHLIGDQIGAAMTLNNLAIVDAQLGNIDLAVDRLHQALAVGAELGDRRIAEQYEDAEISLHRGLADARATGNRSSEAFGLHGLGHVHQALGRLVEAVEHYRAALPIQRETGRQLSEAGTLTKLGDALHGLGHRAEAD